MPANSRLVSRRRVGAAAAVCGLAITTLVACGSPADQPENGTAGGTSAESPTTPVPTYDLQGVPGTVLESGDFAFQSQALTDSGAAVYRVVYESTSGIDNAPTAVSGVAAVPSGTPPEGGWPIVVYGHGTTGVQADCGPSLYPDLMGYDGALASFAELGYVTVLPDYQGLGTGGGTHPYLEPRTSGQNMIDAARAVHSALPNTSPRWAAVGVSQGGQAAWAANELDASYGSGLDLVGTVAMSPPTDLTPLAGAANNGTLTPPQKEIMPYVLYGMKQVDPTFDIGQYTRSVAEANEQLLLTCVGGDTAAKSKAVQEMAPDEFASTSAESAQKFAEAIGRYTLPQAGVASPMLVVYGGQDNIVLPQWTEDAIRKACALGDPVLAELQPGSGHDVNTDLAKQFLADRFAGAAEPQWCG